MEENILDGQSVLHCVNCGGSFFLENGVNRISLTSAQDLAAETKISNIFTEDKLCPKDQTLLVPFRSVESIPPDVTLFHCNTCRGIFTFPNDLVIFKKAQAAKIDYFKLWNIPLPSIKSIAVLSVFLFVSLLSLLTYTYWQNQNISNIQAQDLVKNIYLTSANRYLFISFKTLLPLKSRLIFSDATSGQTLEKIVNSQSATFHQLTTADVNLENQIYYQIILTDEKGRETKTEMKRLEITK